MTTDNKSPQEEVSASEESVSAEKIADELTAAEEQPQDDVQPPAPAPASFDSEELITRIERSVQGRSANAFGQFRKQIREELEETLKPIREFSATVEQARVEQMDPEEQAAYWRRKATEQAQRPAPTAPEPEPDPDTYTPQQQQELSASVNGMLEGMDLDPQLLRNPELWKGWQPGDSVERAKRVALTNARRLKAEAAGRTAPAAQPPTTPPPPSTNGAPRQSANVINTRTEAYEAFSDGRIKNSTQLNAALAEIRTKGKAVL